MYRTTTLDNGLTVATAQMPHMSSVSLGLWIGTGGRHEPASLSGIAHFIEHLLFKGTAKRGPRDISVAVEGVGGELNAFTAEENTCYYAKAPAGRWPELLEVLTDMYLHAQFAPREIRLERSVIKEEIALYHDQPHQHVLELLNELLWPDQPLGRCLTGSPATLDAIRRRHLLEFRRQHYVAANTLVCAAGPVEHDAILRRVRRATRRLAPGQRPSCPPAHAPSRARQLRIDRRRIDQVQIALGFPVCSRHDPRRHALRMLNTILGENMSSRLFQVVREQRGLVYSIQSSLHFFEDAGVLTVAAGLDLPQLPRTLRLIARELSRLGNELPSRTEVRKARDYLAGQLDLSLESTENQMMWMGEHLLGHGRITPPRQVQRRLAQVTPAQIRQVARAFLRPPILRLAMIGPSPGKLDLLRCLRF